MLPKQEEKTLKEPSIKVVGKVSAILEAFSRGGPELSLKDISGLTGIELSTTSRLVSSLLDVNLLRYDQIQRVYSPSLRILELSRIILQRFDFREIAHREMLALSRLHGWEMYLAVLDEPFNGCIVYIDAISPGPEQVERSQVGQIRPAHSTATGKVLLAAQRVSLEELDLTPRTPATITSVERLEAELAECRSRGWAVTRGEEDVEAAGVAVPVYGRRNDSPIAALGASTAPERFDDEMATMIESLQVTTRGIGSLAALLPEGQL